MKVTEEPAQIVVSFDDKVTIGAPGSVNVTDIELEQVPSDTVTVYIPDVKPVAVTVN